MIEPLMLMLSLSLGAILGLFYFCGLWFTLRRLHDSKQPALLTFGSFLGRTVVCVLGFYLILGSGIEALILSVVGFILAKIILINRIAVEGRLNG